MGLFGTVCPVCGEKNKARLQYCVRCGSPLDFPALPKAPALGVPGPGVAPGPEKAPPSGGSRSKPGSMRAVYLVAWIALLVVARLVPHPYNYLCVGAIVVFSFVLEIVRQQGRSRR